MATCVGCGAELAPEWKYCIHCGIATDAREIPAAIRPEAPVVRRRRISPLVIAGIAAFLVGIALLILSIAYLVGALR
jgi:hypothetical protein